MCRLSCAPGGRSSGSGGRCRTLLYHHRRSGLQPSVSPPSRHRTHLGTHAIVHFGRCHCRGPRVFCDTHFVCALRQTQRLQTYQKSDDSVLRRSVRASRAEAGQVSVRFVLAVPHQSYTLHALQYHIRAQGSGLFCLPQDHPPAASSERGISGPRLRRAPETTSSVGTPVSQQSEWDGR